MSGTSDKKKRRILQQLSSSSSSSSSSGSCSSGSSSEEELSDSEIARREEEAERRRRKDPVRRRYLLEDAREGGDDSEEDEEDDQDEEEEEVEDKDNSSVSSSSSRRSSHSGMGEGVKKKKKKRHSHDEDLSAESAFANMRALHAAMDEDEESDDEEDDEDGNSATDSVPDIDITASPASVHYNEGEEEDGQEAEEHNAETNTANTLQGLLPDKGAKDVDTGDLDAGDCHNEDGSASDNDDEGRSKTRQQELQEEAERMEALMRKQLYYDPDCCNNLSRSMRIVNMQDVQVDPNVDGYVYCFTSVADGPVLSQMALKQILVLLHVIFSFIPEECILETEYLKPTFVWGSSSSSASSGASGGGVGGGGLEKLQKKVPMTAEEAERAQELRKKLASMPLCDMPFSEAFNISTAGAEDAPHRELPEETDETENDSAFQRMRRSVLAGRKSQQHTLQIVDVADILVVPVCVTHKTPPVLQERGNNNSSTSSHGDDEEEDDEDDSAGGGGENREKITGFWMVMLKTRKCYNFAAHLHWLVSAVDKKDKSNARKSIMREYEDVMAMLREIIMYQYEQSPNAVAFFRQQGPGSRIDPLQRLTEVCTPDSLDHVCSVYEAYRSMVFHVLKEDSRREILHVTGFTDTILFTGNLLKESLQAQKRWHEAFREEKKRIADHREEISKASRIKDPAEKEARMTEIERERQTEGTAHLPDPVLYPILAAPAQDEGEGFDDNDGEEDGDDELVFDEYNDQGGKKRKRQRRRQKSIGPDYDDEGRMCTGIPAFPLVMWVDIQGKWTEEKSLIAFQGKFGGLPARAMLEVTKMMYRTGAGGMANVQRGRRRGNKRGRYMLRNGDASSLSSASSPELQLPEEIFLPDPKIVQMHTRMKMFRPDEFTMEGIRRAGCDSHLYDRIANVMRNCPDNVQKLQLFSEYVQRILRQHVSSVLNNDLRSNHALYTVKYLEQAKFGVCRDLRHLIREIAPGLYNFTRTEHPRQRAGQKKRRSHLDEDGEEQEQQRTIKEEAYAQEARSPSYWQLNSSNTFLTYSWLLDDLLREHNERFFYLTPQNLKISNDMWTGMVQFRLGQHEEWAYMGMTTVICDAYAKLRKAAPGFGAASNPNGIINTEKRTSSGLDLDREVVDTRRTSYKPYLKGWQFKEDAQKLTQLRRTSEGGLQMGYVLFVNGEVEKLPESELAQDCVLPEGPPDKFEIMVSLFNSIPRDADHTAELWTTVDKNKDNVRAKAVYKLLPGFSLYLSLMAKNFTFESKTESRYRDLLIVCNVQASSGPNDTEGLYYMLDKDSNGADGAGADAKNMRKLMDKFEDGMDMDLFRRGVMRNNAGTKCNSKGPRPGDKDQKLWAPFLYFTHSVAGTLVAMMHKLGMYRLRINYGVVSVTQYLYDYVTSTLKDFIDKDDESAASRYFSSYKCRMVAETVLRTTFMSMSVCKNQDAAVVHAINTLNYNALHLSLIPVLQERLIQRLLRYDVLLGMATLGISMQVPVVSMKSIMQLMNGCAVTDQQDLLAMRKFVQDALDQNNMVHYMGMDGYGMPADSPLPGYVTCRALRETFSMNPSSNGDGSASGRTGFGSGGAAPAGGGGSNVSHYGIPMEPIHMMIKKIYKENSKTLKNSAFVPDYFSFHQCITSLMDRFDLRDFFGGMQAYHNIQRMVDILGVDTPFSFASDFVDGGSGQTDHVMIAARVPRVRRSSPAVQLSSSHFAEADYCIALRIPDVLLWFAIMRRPRRDVGLCSDFAHTLAEFSIQLLPRSIFPYDLVPMTRLDPINKSQVMMDTQYNKERYGGPIFRPSVIPRTISNGITTPNFTLKCKGMVGTKTLEDEMYMSEILMMAEDLGMKWFEFPLDSCPTLTIHWEYGVCYPLTRYFEVPPGTAAGSRGDAATGSIPEEEEEEEDDKQEQLFLEELSGYSEAVLYFNPVRHSMMLFAVSPCFGENGRRSMKEIVVGDGKKKQLADGGRAWIPHIELAHEFSLLPGLKPCEMKQPLPGGNCRTMMHSQRVERGLRGMMPGARFSSSYSDQLHCLELGGEGAGDGIMTWGGVTSGCSSVQDMQNRLFALGFGPLPYFRRPGVVLLISPDESEDDSPEKYLIGCVVAHGPAHTPQCSNASCDLGVDEEEVSNKKNNHRCYMCCGHPFVEVLFHNPRSAYDYDNGMEEDSHFMFSATVPVTPRRAVFRALPVGTRLVMSLGTLADDVMVNSAFNPMQQSHLIDRIRAQLLQEERMSMGQVSGDDASLVEDKVRASKVQCFLNITSVMRCVDGFVCIAVSCVRIGAENAGSQVRNLYVAPQHLRVPEDEAEWEGAVPYVLI